MALFKPLKGSRASLDSQPLHDGYAYFCVDDGSFHIDVTDSEGVLQRKQVNAKDAETLTGMTLEEIQKSISWEDLNDRPFYEETTEVISTSENSKTLQMITWRNNNQMHYYDNSKVEICYANGDMYSIYLPSGPASKTSHVATNSKTGQTITVSEAFDSKYRQKKLTVDTNETPVSMCLKQVELHKIDPIFLPSEIARTSDVDTALATKAEVEHTHEISDVNGLQTALDNLELITVEDIDTICGTVIQLASETTF